MSHKRSHIIWILIAVFGLIAVALLFDTGAKTVTLDKTKSAKVEENKFLPNPTMTPGTRFPRVTKQQICTVGYTKTVRDVKESKKKAVFSLYNTDRTKDEYEVDHLISLQLGGNNDLGNLWPQSYTTQPWNARIKDKLENKLNDEICKGRLSMKEAQQRISTDWILTYCDYYNDKEKDCKQYKEKYK
jgi:hypothetical protein